jgi:hypothetical protein
MNPCPHCGQPVRDEYTHCPFCGTDVATGERTENVRGGGDDAGVGGALGCTLSGLIYFFYGAGYLETGNLLFAARQGHLEWGTAAHLLSQRHEYLWLGFGLPILLTGLTYLLLRRRFPKFARGLGYSGLVALVIALGAPFLCGNSQ